MIGKGEAFGAITIINAIAIGKGAAIGVKMKTEAWIKILDEPVVEGEVYINGKRESCDLNLIKAVKDVVFKRFKINGGMKAVVKSNIPISKGLKSSSAVANALVNAILDAIKEDLNDLDVIKLGVKAAKKAEVTITGAFDDACSSLLGGLCITDNLKLRLLKREEIDEKPVIIYVPKEKIPTATLKKVDFKILSPYIEEAFNLVLKGKWRKAMIANGLAYASFLGYNIKPIFDALNSGAFAVGLSGTGPAIAAITDNPEDIVAAWSRDDADIILTEIR